MKKYLLPVIALLFIGFSANAQLDSTKVIDNKGTIKYVLKANNSKIITQQDSLVLYVTPKQLNDFKDEVGDDYVKYADTSAMLSNYLNAASSGLTKSGQSVKLGGTLTENATITTSETNLLQIRGLQSGSATADSVMVVDPANGTLKWISASKLFNALTFENGLTKDGNTVKLGGALNEATTITTDATNVLKIAGLQSGNLTADSLVVAGSDGTLKRVTRETLLQSGDVQTVASANQTNVTVADMPANPSKVWVYRNGAKLMAGVDFTTTAGAVTLTPTPDWSVVAGDIIEVQWVK
jgi:hypothetical protein